MARTKKTTARGAVTGIRGGIAAAVRGGKKVTASTSSGKAHGKVAKNTGSAGAQGKKRRWKAGTVALREIRRYQKTFDLLLPKIPFQRLVREIMSDVAGLGKAYRIQKSALQALQEAVEAFMIGFLSNSHLCTIHAKRVTLQVKDVRLIKQVMSNLGLLYFQD